MTTIAIIGYGEVGTILAQDLEAQGATVTAYDPAAAAQSRAQLAHHARRTPQEAVHNADIVIVATTAASALEAMRALTTAIGHAPYILDVNSTAPSTKQQAARLMESAGGRYVEAAVMASMPPKRLRTPMLLGGPHAAAFIAACGGFQMDLTDFSPEIGRASSVKMCRSVMIKGLEALTTECMLAARHYGVEADVLATMGDTLPHADWHGLARYVISRALIHGKRRAEEMREVARTVEDAGIEPLLSRAIAERQDWAARQGAAMGAARDLPTLEPLLDALTAATRLPKAAE